MLRSGGTHDMLNDDELAAFQQRSQAGMLRSVDAKRMLTALLGYRVALQEAEQQLRGWQARDQDNQTIIAVQRGEISKLRATIASLRRELSIPSRVSSNPSDG